jgi:hypothetical protein
MKMKKTILITILFLLVISVTASPQLYYILDLENSNDEISLKKISIQPLNEEPIESSGYYVAEVVSFDNEILNLTFFTLTNTILYDTIDNVTGKINGGGIIEENLTEVQVIVPYYNNAKEINIYNKNLNKLLTISVTKYSDNLVESNSLEMEETNVSESSNVLTVEDIPKGDVKENSYWLWIIVVVGIIILAGLIFFLYQKKK